MQTDTDEGVHLALLLHELADHRLGLTHLGHCEGAHLFRVAVCTLEHTHAVARGGRWGLSTACMPVRTSMRTSIRTHVGKRMRTRVRTRMGVTICAGMGMGNRKLTNIARRKPMCMHMNVRMRKI